MLSAGRRSQLAERQRAQVQAEAERLHQMLERLPENVPGMIYQYRLDADGSSRFPYSTEGVREIYGLAPEAVREDASAVLARLHPRDLDRVLQGIQESARTLGVWEDEYRVLLPDRGLRWVHGIARPQRVEADGVLWHGYIHDVTEQRQVRERLDRLLRNVPGALFQIQLHRDGSKRFPYVSAGVKSVYGLSPQELYEDAGRLQARIHPEDLPEWLASTVVSARDLSLWEQEFRVRLPERGERWIHAIAQPERIHDDAVQWYGYAYDVTEAKQQQLRLEATERQLRELAYVDGLTGVANRRHFDEQLQIEWRRCERSGQPLSLLMIDIDHFKHYNDQYGHQQGDGCLQAVAGALRTVLGRAHDLVARYGGEEFVCLLPEVDAAGALSVAESLRTAVQALQLPHASSPVAGVVTVSIGAASGVPREDGKPADLLARADASLYRAKSEGRNRVALDGA